MIRRPNNITKDLFYTHIKCPNCNGSGMYDYGIVWDHGDPGYTTCHKCNGAGVVKNI